MDQLKDFLKQCVKYRFWIAFGVSLLLPMIGYFVGSGAINAKTKAEEGVINAAKTDVSKYASGTIVNGQYQPEAAKKKDVLTQDVDTTWRKLFATQEPLLRWPGVVEENFRKWGRKYPNDVDAGYVQRAINDYTIAYPEFVSQIYTIFKPFNFEDGSGIVVAPAEAALITPAQFSIDALPEFGKVRAEQERLWVVTALLDVVAKVNASVGAKDWDGAAIKQLNLVEVGAPTDQDQKSLAKGDELVPAEDLKPEGAPAEAAPPSEAGMPGMPGMKGGGARGASDIVYYLKTEGQQYKILPIKMNVLVEQSRLQDFLVGLENSPMSIQVMEFELAKPLVPVVKPTYGDRASFGFGGMAGMESGMPGMMGGRGMRGGAGPMPGMMPGPMGGPGGGEMSMRGGMPGMTGGNASAPKSGTSIREKNLAKERKDRERDAAKAKSKAEPKARLDQYYNVIEVTVYGQARFYLAPPPPPSAEPSTAAPAEAPAPAPEAAKPDEAPKPEAAAPKGDEPKAEPAAPKGEAPGPDAQKAGAQPPKS